MTNQRTCPGTGARLIAAAFVLHAAVARPDCKSPLPTAAVHELDARVDRDPAGVAADAARWLARAEPKDVLLQSELLAIEADAYSLLDDDEAVLHAVALGRAKLAGMANAAARQLIDNRLTIVAADSYQGPANVAAGVDGLTQLLTTLPVGSLDRACAYIVRSRQLGRLGRVEAATTDAVRGYQLASALHAPAAVADAANELAFTYLRAGLGDDGLLRAEEAAQFDRSTGRTARLSNDLYVKAKLLALLDRPAEALAVMDETRVINVQLHQDIDIAFDDMFGCEMRLASHEYELASKLCLAAERVMNSSGKHDLLAVIEGDLAQIETAQGRPGAAIARLDRVLQAEQQRVDVGTLPDLYRQRAEALARAGRYQAAWRDLQSADRLADSQRASQESLGAAAVKERLNTSMVREEKATLEHRLQEEQQHALDRERLYRLRLALLVAAGLLAGAVAILMWIRVRHERVQRMASERLNIQAQVISTMREGVLLFDALGQIQYANPSLLRMFGVRLEDLVNQPVSRLGVDFAASLEADHGECQVHDVAGRHSSLLVSRSSLPLPGKAMQICILQDVTELRRLERQVHAATSAELGRLGTVVHEGIAQDLAGISLLMGTIQGRSNQDSELLARITAHISDVITHARALARGLSPVHAAGGSLVAALSQHGRELAARRRIEFSCRPAPNLPALSDVQSHQLVRMIGDALDWVADAPDCASVQLQLDLVGDSLVARIRGNGRPEAAQAEPGAQLSTVTYLARLLGGRLEPQRLPAGGRELVFTLSMGSAGIRGPGDAPGLRQH